MIATRARSLSRSELAGSSFEIALSSSLVRSCRLGDVVKRFLPFLLLFRSRCGSSAAIVSPRHARHPRLANRRWPLAFPFSRVLVMPPASLPTPCWAGGYALKAGNSSLGRCPASVVPPSPLDPNHHPACGVRDVSRVPFFRDSAPMGPGPGSAGPPWSPCSKPAQGSRPVPPPPTMIRPTFPSDVEQTWTRTARRLKPTR